MLLSFKPKKYSYFFALISILTVNLYASEIITLEKNDVNINRWQIYKHSSGSVSTHISASDYRHCQLQFSNYYDNESNLEETWASVIRVLTQFKIGDNIPQDAEIIDAYFTINGLTSEEPVLSASQFNASGMSLQAAFNAMGNSDYFLEEELESDGTEIIIESEGLVNAIQQLLNAENTDNWFTALGCKLKNDSYSFQVVNDDETIETIGSLNFDLVVEYLPKHSINIKNSFGAGFIKVDGIDRQSGSTFSWEESTEHTLQGFNQDFDGSHWIFTDTWLRNGSTTIQGNSITIIVSGDVAYEAIYKREVDVIVDQVDKDGQRLTGSSVYHWHNNDFEEHTLTADQAYEFTANSGDSEVLRGSQEIIESQKYNKWQGIGDVKNHNNFNILNQNEVDFTSQFEVTVGGVSIQNDLSGLSGGTIQFKDPWYIDYADPSYDGSKRNRGMAAPFISRSSPFHPDLTTAYENGNQYQGVFLEQGYYLGEWAPPYYSVKAEAEQTIPVHGEDVTFDFLGWSASGAGFQDADANQTPVVFQQPGAEVQANYKGRRISGANLPFGYTNGRNSLYLGNSTLYKKATVYEDNGKIYFSGLRESISQPGTWYWDKDRLLSGDVENCQHPSVSPIG
jgi:hypothetical protein